MKKVADKVAKVADIIEKVADRVVKTAVIIEKEVEKVANVAQEYQESLILKRNAR